MAPSQEHLIDLDTALGRSAEPGELQSMIRAQVPVAQSGQRREM